MNKILDIIITICIFIITIALLILVVHMCNDTVYVQSWTDPATSTNYIITNQNIIKEE